VVTSDSNCPVVIVRDDKHVATKMFESSLDGYRLHMQYPQQGAGPVPATSYKPWRPSSLRGASTGLLVSKVRCGAPTRQKEDLASCLTANLSACTIWATARRDAESIPLIMCDLVVNWLARRSSMLCHISLHNASRQNALLPLRVSVSCLPLSVVVRYSILLVESFFILPFPQAIFVGRQS